MSITDTGRSKFVRGDPWLGPWLCLYIGLVLALGPSPLAVVIFEGILNGMALFSHSNIALPEKLYRILRFVVVTPDMHRIHHSIEKMETNANFGFNLSIWDRFLGTYIQDAKKNNRK